MSNEEAIKSLEAQRDCIILSCSGACHEGKECDECDFMYGKGTMGEMRDAYDVAIKALQEKQIVWHPYPKEKPTKGGLYLVTISNSKDRVEVRTYWYIDCEDGFGESFSRTLQIWTVTAWAEMPKPYGEGAEE